MRSNLVQNWQFQPWHFANFVSCQGDWSLVPCLWCVEEVETGILTKIVFGLCWAYVVFLLNMGNLKWTSFWRRFVTSWKWRLPIVFCDFTEGKMGWKSGEYMSCFPELPLKNSGHWRLLFDWDFWWKRKPTGAGAGGIGTCLPLHAETKFSIRVISHPTISMVSTRLQGSKNGDTLSDTFLKVHLLVVCCWNSPGESLGVCSHLLLGSLVLLNFNSGGVNRARADGKFDLGNVKAVIPGFEDACDEVHGLRSIYLLHLPC